MLDDAPNALGERRFQSPTRASVAKLKKNIHVEEPATKRSIVVEVTDDEDNLDIGSFNASWKTCVL